ncbi:MAG: TolC family protein [Bacteroidales bacterium]|nr:TolC family protein [Bacteroidales bacterium]
MPKFILNNLLFKLLFSTSFLLFINLNVFSQNGERLLKEKLPEFYPLDSIIEQSLPIEELWWKSFDDRLLDSLMNVAISGNWDIIQAQKRIIQARSTMRSAYGALLPSFSLDAGWQRNKASQNTTGVTLSNDPFSSYFSGTVNMSWEIDVFGSVWQTAREQKNLYKASKADYYATMVSMAASLGSAYINLRTTQKSLEVVSANIISQKEVLRITEARNKAGLASMLDVTQAKSTYYNTKAAITSYQIAEQTYINSIAILLGTLPSNISPILSQIAPLPQGDRLVPVDIPASLLRQRPDVKAAEYQVNAKAAALGASKADWLPQFFITGEIGFVSHDMDHLFKEKSLVWQIAPVMKWTIFNGGQRFNGVVSAKAALESSVANYNLVVLTALQEVENAIISYNLSSKENLELKTAVSEGVKSFELALDLYKQGLSAFINVLNAQQSLLAYQTSYVSSQGSKLLYLIQLYQALGGGWTIDKE